MGSTSASTWDAPPVRESLDHIHIHVVPRWSGDTNFMSVVGNVRVLPEELSHSAARLRPVFERVAG